MKDIHQQVPTDKEKKKIPSAVAKFAYTSTYTVTDCMNARNIAKKYNISAEKAQKILKTIQTNNEQILINGQKKPAVIKIHGKHGPFLHPLATMVLEQYLQKIKE